MTRSANASGWIVVCSLLTFGFLAVPCSRAQEPSSFVAATMAFEQGDYARALDLFEAARAAGLDTPALHYNLGVCQYRVGDYEQAAATFRLLGRRFEALRPLAEYNYGLALLALGRRDPARAAFERARAEGDARLAALAGSALAEIGPDSSAVPPTSWLGYLDFDFGHDTNVALVDDVDLPAGASSAFMELLGYASHRFPASMPLHLDFSGYLVRYADVPQFDQDSLRVELIFEWSTGPWRFAAGPYLATSTLDGDGFEQTVGASVRATRRLNERLEFNVRLLYDDIDAPTDRFDYIAGTRERLRFGLERRLPRRRVRIGYEIERQDRSSPSVSPERRRLVLDLGRRLNERWSIDGALSHRTSHYRDLLVPREETLNELAAGVRRDLTSGWLFNAEFRWADNDSDLAPFSYRSSRFGIGLSRSF